MTREQPWHLRRANSEHHRWYRNLADLHALTLAWLKELGSDAGERASHRLPRGFSSRGSAGAPPEVLESLWMLESLGPTGARDLEALLDDTSPDDLLGRLERTVWTVQAWTLASVIEKSSAKDRAPLLNQLEQASWKAGRDCALARWPHFPDKARADLRGILSACRGTPIWPMPPAPDFLIARTILGEARLELLSCPHQRAKHADLAAIRSVADELCRLHGHWIRGFVYALNPRIGIEIKPGTGSTEETCRQDWALVPG